MFGKFTRCARGVMVQYDGAWCLVEGLGCNPFIVVREFNRDVHAIVERQVYLPPQFYALIAALAR